MNDIKQEDFYELRQEIGILTEQLRNANNTFSGHEKRLDKCLDKIERQQSELEKRVTRVEKKVDTHEQWVWWLRAVTILAAGTFLAQLFEIFNSVP